MAPDPAAAAPWMTLARLDLKSARLLLAAADAEPVMFGYACFHAQQCAEKSLKALMAVHGVAVPYSHDLLALGRRIGAHVPAPEDIERGLAGLTDYGVGPRYPDAGFDTTQAVADAAIQHAAAVYGWARAEIEPK